MSKSTGTLSDVLGRHEEVFSDELGCMSQFTAKLEVRPGATPRFCRARPVPFALKGAIERELDSLESKGVLEKVSHADWAAPIVAVPKSDGTVRLCGDYKVTVNRDLDVDQYPLPVPEDLMSSLTGGQAFTKLDLSSAYQQMPLEEESRKYVTINTHRGLYRYTRLPFGIASAPAIFQKAMDAILQGLDHVICYLDDILITGVSEEEHLRNLDTVLGRLREHGVRLKRGKCSIWKSSVDYLGHHIDAKGIHTAPGKVAAITQAPAPRNVSELRSFLGMVNYYGKFIQNLAMLLHPLNELLRDGQPWDWTKERDAAFQEAKQQLASAPVLVHYDPKLPIRLAGDASSYGIGAVLSQVLPDGSEHPVAFASRALRPSEKNYAQLEKEALSLIYGISKFHKYIYGRHFTLVTDHRPLTAILGPKTGVPSLAAARLQRWALALSTYSYSIEFRSTKAHANADGLSRLPLPLSPQEGPEQPAVESVFAVSQMQALPMSVARLRRATRNDPLLSRVYRYVQRGWPDRIPESLKPFHNRKTELSLEGGCVLWGIRVVVPRKCRQAVVDMLHEGHPGIVRMKSIARGYVWWPGLDADLSSAVKECLPCQQEQKLPAAAPLHPWLWPDRPWDRVHVDFAGPFRGRMFLIMVDAHSKWPEVVSMSSTTSTQTITVMRRVFSQFGIPKQLVSDNGPQFTSAEFVTFCQANGIKHVRTAPYHPASNGLAERFVQSFKVAMKKAEHDGLPFEQRLASFLLTYRTTSHATTGVAPCVLFLGRSVRTRLDMLRPDTSVTVSEKQADQKQKHDQRSDMRHFQVGQSVMVRDFLGSTKWIEGTIHKCVGPVTYLVKICRGMVWKRHVDHIRDRTVGSGDISSNEGEEGDPDDGADGQVDVPVESTETPADVPVESTETPTVILDQPDFSREAMVPLVPLPTPVVVEDTESSTPRRNPPRNRQVPARFQQ